MYENVEMELEERCFSIVTDKRYGTTINPYPITEEDLMDCNGKIPEQFEESLDDHEKLLFIGFRRRFRDSGIQEMKICRGFTKLIPPLPNSEMH